MTASDPAKARFLAITLIRLSGVAFAILGTLAIAGKVPLPAVAGYVLLAVGLFDVLAMPLILAKRWKSPRP